MSRNHLVLLCSVLLALACSGPQWGPRPGAGTSPPANFAVVTYEIVAKAEDDSFSRNRIYVDGQFVGQTEPGPRSLEKRWEGYLLPGNHLIRCERWMLPSVSDWVLDAAAAPWERFVRIEEGMRSTVSLKYIDGGTDVSFEISRELQRGN